MVFIGFVIFDNNQISIRYLFRIHFIFSEYKINSGQINDMPVSETVDDFFFAFAFHNVSRYHSVLKHDYCEWFNDPGLPMKESLFPSSQADLFSEPDNEAKPEIVKNDHQALKKRLDKLLADTDDFRILERIPLTKPGIDLPYSLSEKKGDEIAIVILDTETTGLSSDMDLIIELGLVRALFSPSAQRLVSIERIVSAYEDPGRPITPFITELTGITDDMVRGKRIDEAMVAEVLSDAVLVVAHNAAFDRPFFEKRFKGFEEKKWACSLTGIAWNELGFKNLKQEELLLKSGYFYEAHRASIDCLALGWLLHCQPDAFASLLELAKKKTVTVQAFGAPFDAKDRLKSRGYRWHDGTTGPNRHWWKEIAEEELAEEKAFLDELYAHGSERAGFSFKTASERFKSL